jgi:uncharacterized damage-inducible protein DinB
MTHGGSTAVITQLLAMLDSAFEGSRWQSVIGNLEAVPEDAWKRAPGGEARAIADLAMHLAYNAFGTQARAFGGGCDEAELTRLATAAFATREGTMAFLREHHARLRASIAALTDEDLDTERMTHLGPRPTPEIIAGVIEHDLYHAGEINAVRALFQGDSS